MYAWFSSYFVLMFLLMVLMLCVDLYYIIVLHSSDDGNADRNLQALKLEQAGIWKTCLILLYDNWPTSFYSGRIDIKFRYFIYEYFNGTS